MIPHQDCVKPSVFQIRNGFILNHHLQSFQYSLQDWQRFNMPQYRLRGFCPPGPRDSVHVDKIAWIVSIEGPDCFGSLLSLGSIARRDRIDLRFSFLNTSYKILQKSVVCSLGSRHRKQVLNLLMYVSSLW